jgi:hypothetical protein
LELVIDCALSGPCFDFAYAASVEFGALGHEQGVVGVALNAVDDIG